MQIKYNRGPLKGAVTGCFVFGINYLNGDRYFKNSFDNWELITSDVTANNGLSIEVTLPGNVQMGGPLLKNTDISLNTKDLTFSGTGKVGIGTTVPLTIGQGLEINGGTGLSGLKFTELNSTSPSIPNTSNKVLGLSTTGDVILVDNGGMGTDPDCCTPIDVTYAELQTLINTSTLVPLSTYRLTDYRSANYLNGYSTVNRGLDPAANFNPTEVHYGPIEVLRLKAITNNTIEPIAFSESYPEDIIEYIPYVNFLSATQYPFSRNYSNSDGTITGTFPIQWDANNVAYVDLPTGKPLLLGYTLDISINIQSTASGNYSANASFNQLHPRINIPSTVNTNPQNLGFRIVPVNGSQRIMLLDIPTIYQNTALINAANLDMQYYQSTTPITGWISRRNDTIRNIDVPFDFRGQKFRRFEINIDNIIGTDYYGIGPLYKGYTTTGNFKDFYSFGNNGTINNIIIDYPGGPICEIDNNVILQDFSNIKINNVIRDNSLGSIINLNSDGAMIDNLVAYIYDIKIKSYFADNKINSIADSNFYLSFYSNTISSTYNNNDTFTEITNTNFSSATHVYGNYYCKLYKKSNTGIKLVYDNVTEVAITA